MECTWAEIGVLSPNHLKIWNFTHLKKIKKKIKNPKTKVIATKEDIRPCLASLKKEFSEKTLKVKTTRSDDKQGLVSGVKQQTQLIQRF